MAMGSYREDGQELAGRQLQRSAAFEIVSSLWLDLGGQTIKMRACFGNNAVIR